MMTMKFGQLMEHPKRNTLKKLFKNYTENETGKLVPECFLFFKKSFILAKSKWSELDLTIFR